MAADAADDELRLVQAASGALHAAAEQANRAAALQATAVEMQKAADEARMMAEIQVGGRHTRLDCKLKANEADCNKVLLGGGGGGGGGYFELTPLQMMVADEGSPLQPCCPWTVLTPGTSFRTPPVLLRSYPQRGCCCRR